MRTLTFYIAITLVCFNITTQAKNIDCITLNAEVTKIQQLTKSGQYRELAHTSKPVNFDYQTSKTYQEYLRFARKKILQENPKATIKCPISTSVTKAFNQPKEQLIITDLIAPFELKAKQSKRAILLIHGLTDSPFLFHDLAAFFQAKDITVRTLLLPGHGTAPEALTEVDYKHWQQATRFAIKKTLQDFEQVYLGGFSTGGALVLDHLLSASHDLSKIKGIMLWAPATKAKSSFAWAAQIVDWIPFVDYAHKGADIDFAKYESFPLNAGAQVHALMNELQEKLTHTNAIPDIPLFTVISEVDSTINTQTTLQTLKTWHSAKNRATALQDTVFYFGDTASLTVLPSSIQRILPLCDNSIFCSNILDVAHTSMTNAPTNPHYGWQGSYRNCEASSGEAHYKTCKTTNMAKLGETTAANLKQHPDLQRLTFNPNFDQMIKAIEQFLSATQ